MDPQTMATLYQNALSHHRNKNLREVEACCRQILACDPRHVAALQLLAHTHAEQGQFSAAADVFHQFTQVLPQQPDGYFNLGSVLARAGRFDEAATAYERTLALSPRHAEAYRCLGHTRAAAGRDDAAIKAWQQSLNAGHEDVATWEALGQALNRRHRYLEAIEAFEQVTRKVPRHVSALVNLGIALAATGKLNEALKVLQAADGLSSGMVEVHVNLGNVLMDLGRLEEAVTSFKRALELRPDMAEIHYNFGNALWHQGNLDHAANELRRAIAIRPDHADAIVNLGNVLRHMGEPQASIECFDRALELRPADLKALSARIFALHHDPEVDPVTLRDAQARWGRVQMEKVPSPSRRYANDPSTHRKLRIGYVSGDFRTHSVARFLRPLFEHHDRQSFDICCYSEVRLPDTTTNWFRRSANHWRDITSLGDEQAADLIRGDGVDILVDLSMHTNNNRLGVFAHKPAPVQATYLAYASGTGLPTIDYRISDHYLDPIGQADGHYVEQTWRLTGTYWCYQPDDSAPEPGPLPVLNRGQIMFGCLNNFSKINPLVLQTWARILTAVPTAHLMLHAREGQHRQHLLDLLKTMNISAERIRFTGRLPFKDFLQLYHEIDIALDPFPFNGGTTTCDALWMGVPVISLAGSTGVGRAGLSILSNAALPELVAGNPDDYVSMATELAGNLDALVNMRRNLRRQMQASPLMDAPKFAYHMEQAFRDMWALYCAQQSVAVAGLAL